MAEVDVTELLWLAVAVMAAGIVTGLLAGLFGIGGGAVIVPVLFEVFRISGVPEEIRMQLCVGTSLAIIVPTAVRSYRTHRAKGMVIAEVMRAWTWPAVVGVALGSAAAAFAPPWLFKIAFVLIAGVIAVPAAMILHSSVLRTMAHAGGTAIPASYVNVFTPAEFVLLALAGLVIGVVGALLPASWAARARTATALRAE